MTTVKMGIIGIGAQGGTYAQFIAEGKVKNMVLGAICDIDPEKKAMCAEKYPDVPFYDNYIDMLESGDVTAVVTTVPHSLHPEMGEGNLDMPAIMEAGLEAGAQYFLVEQDDVYGRDPFDCLQTSANNLRKLGYADWF